MIDFFPLFSGKGIWSYKKKCKHGAESLAERKSAMSASADRAPLLLSSSQFHIKVCSICRMDNFQVPLGENERERESRALKKIDDALFIIPKRLGLGILDYQAALKKPIWRLSGISLGKLLLNANTLIILTFSTRSA